MAVDASVVGLESDEATWRVEEGKIREFARAVGITDPLCTDPEAALAAGFTGVVAPPTFAITAGQWAPTWKSAARICGFDVKRLLHGEQRFTLHRPICAGDVLVGRKRIVDLFEKEGKRGGTMTFVTEDTVWRDAGTGDPVVTTTTTLIETAKRVEKD